MTKQALVGRWADGDTRKLVRPSDMSVARFLYGLCDYVEIMTFLSLQHTGLHERPSHTGGKTLTKNFEVKKLP